MSRGLRRNPRPIETGGIVPDAIRRQTVRTETLRIAAVSPTVMSGSRREPLPAAPYCLLPDGCSLTASASRSDDGRVPQSFWSSRLRLFELERWLGQTAAAAQEGISGDGIVDLYFDRPGIEFVVVVQRVVVRGAVSNGYIGRAGNPRSSTKRGRQVRSCHPPRDRIRTISLVPKPNTNWRRFWGRPPGGCVFVAGR